MSFAAQAFPAAPHPAPPRPTSPRQERTGQRAALFRLWRDLAAPEAAAASVVAPIPTAPRAMVSGTVSARFATLMPAMVQLGPAVLGEASPAPAEPPPVNSALAQARQRRLKELLQDDMFIF